MTRTTDEAGIECRKRTHNGIVTLEEYFWEGKRHRPHEAGPAWIARNNAGLVITEAYYWEGKQHRPHEAGPAWITRNNSGLVTVELYYWEGYQHRPLGHGPAVINRNDSGMVTWEAYHLEGWRLYGSELRWARRLRLVEVLFSAWKEDGGKPGYTRAGLRRFLALRRVCRFHPDPAFQHRLVEPFGQAVVAFL